MLFHGRHSNCNYHLQALATPITLITSPLSPSSFPSLSLSLLVSFSFFASLSLLPSSLPACLPCSSSRLLLLSPPSLQHLFETLALIQAKQILAVSASLSVSLSIFAYMSLCLCFSVSVSVGLSMSLSFSVSLSL